jgi:hypothetical protein
MEKLIKSSTKTIDEFVDTNELNVTEQDEIDLSPGEIYVSMLERKVIECGTENDSLHKVNKKLMYMIKKVEEQLEGTDAMTRLRIAWEVASNFPHPLDSYGVDEEEFDYWGKLK